MKLNDEQLVEAIATEVMGWLKTPNMPFWFNSRMVSVGYLCYAVLPSNRYLVFDPLHDHNHAALVEQLICDNGGVINIHLAKGKGHVIVNPTGREFPMASCAWPNQAPSKLRAEMEAILEAARKKK